MDKKMNVWHWREYHFLLRAEVKSILNGPSSREGFEEDRIGMPVLCISYLSVVFLRSFFAPSLNHLHLDLESNSGFCGFHWNDHHHNMFVASLSRGFQSTHTFIYTRCGCGRKWFHYVVVAAGSWKKIGAVGHADKTLCMFKLSFKRYAQNVLIHHSTSR